ncbi:hypothetical protein AB0F07_20260 [Streptomyces fructofermentans]|uniref:hypothetical protein n=1 Tax=Streptomyces fructofermentans TaxID=152141 RepID=UPI0033DFCC58
MLRDSGRRLPGPRRARLPLLAGFVAFMAALPLAAASAGPSGSAAPLIARTSDGVVRALGAGPADRAPGTRRAAGSPDSAGAAGGRDSAKAGSAGLDGAGRSAGPAGSAGGAGPRSGADAAGAAGASRGAGAAGSGSADGTSSASRGRDSSGAPGFVPGLAVMAVCGPELTAPEGVEAQTCVLTRGRDTWARTYYRNATGAPLTSVLTLMGPADRTVLMHCSTGADDEPGMCETPRERTAGDARAYTAVAEFAEGADGPLLLRSGSNSPVR